MFIKINCITINSDFKKITRQKNHIYIYIIITIKINKLIVKKKSIFIELTKKKLNDNEK